MKAKAFKIVNLILAVLVFVFAMSQAFAWFADDMRKSEDKFDGSSASPYFESGDGSEGAPFTLSSYNHLYNLAWLQNTGNLNDRYYYFQLKNDITMPDNFWLPPIGTDEHPFQGYFDGKGKKVINLKTTTDSSKLTGAVSGSSVKYSNAVGMFGMTAAHVGVLIAKIFDLNLINPIVEVASQNASYDTDSGSQATVGIAIGFANCGAEDIGVYNGKLSVQKTGYTTVNSIIGGYDSENVDGSGISGSGTDIGFGGSLNLRDMYTRMKLIKSNSWATPTVTIPSDIDGGAYPEKGYALPLIVENDISNDYYSNKTSEVTSNNNIGYYTGNQAKLYSKNTLNNIYASDVTYASDETTITDIKIWTKRSSISDEAGDIEVTDIDKNIKSAVINLLNYSDSNGRRLYGINLNAQVSQNNGATVKNMVVAGKTYTSDSYLPADAVWFVPQMDGFVKIVLAVFNDGRQGFTMYNISRNTGDTNVDSNNPYNAKLSGVSVIDEFKDSEGNLVYHKDWAREMTKKRIYYYEMPVKAGTEYAIGQANSNGSYLIYLDIGQNAGGEEGGSGTALPTIENIDFIYDDGSSNVVLIKDANFSATKVIVHFSISELTYLYFYRKGAVDNGNTLYVEYSGTQPEAKIGAGGGCDISSKAWSDLNAFIAYTYTTS